MRLALYSRRAREAAGVLAVQEYIQRDLDTSAEFDAVAAIRRRIILRRLFSISVDNSTAFGTSAVFAAVGRRPMFH